MSFTNSISGLLLTMAAVTASAGELTVKVTNLASDQGQVIIELVDRAGYEADGENYVAVGIAVLAARPPERVHRFTNVPAGEYALQVVHDVNNNDALDYSLISGPEEPFGLSGVLQPDMDNFPVWDAVKFTLGSEPKTVSVQLN